MGFKSWVSGVISRGWNKPSSAPASSSPSSSPTSSSSSNNSTSTSSGSTTSSSSGGSSGGSSAGRLQETVTTSELAPKTLAPVRSIDTNKGAVTLKGKSVWSGGGGTATVTTTGSLKPAETKQILASKNITATTSNKLSPSTMQKSAFKKLTYEERQENRKSVIEKNWIVKGKSGGWSAFGTGARAFSKGTAYLGTAIDPVIQKTPLKNLAGYSVRSDIAESVLSDVGKWAFFSPAMVTTAGYYKAVQPTKILYGGTTQKIGANKISTNIVYKTSTGRGGVAKGTTIVKQAGKNTYISGTKVGGIDFKEGYKFPQTAWGAVKPRGYVGGEIAVTKTSGKMFEQIGGGKIITKKGSEEFVSLAKGFKIGKVTGSQGTTITKSGQSFFSGLTASIKSRAIKPIGITFTKVSKSPVAKFTNIPSGTSTATKVVTKTASPILTKSIAEASTKQVVSAAYTTTTSAITPVAAIGGITSGQVSKIKTIKTPTMTVKTIAPTKLKSRYTVDYYTPTKTATKSKVVSSSRVSTTPAITQVTTPANNTPSILNPPITAIPAIPFIAPFVFGFAGGKKGYGRVKTKAKYGYTPSYTALAFGIVGKKKAPTIGKRYTGLEFRPITKQWAAQFNGGTRKRDKRKAIKLFT